jgi:HD-like signal output (HDOD) protein
MSNARIEHELDDARRNGPVRDIAIPPCPDLLLRLRTATAQAEVDWAEIDRIAGADVAMAAALIRQANSPLFALPQPVRTVGQALTVLGLNTAVEVLSGFLLRRALPVHSPALAHFWETSTRRALACEHVGAQLYSLDEGLAHSFGLFCHVGLPVMMMGVRGYTGTLTEALARKDRSFTQTENANHRTDHAVVGAIVARTWRLPAEAAVAIRLHHDIDSLRDARFSEPVRRLVALGLVADHLVQRHEQLPPSADWLTHGPACLDFLQINADEMELWDDQLYPLMAAVTA